MDETAYQRLERRMRRISALADAASVLHWDMATMMPRGGWEARAEQLAALKSVRHAALVSPETADLLEAAEADPSLDAWQRANVRECRRRHAKAAAVPEDLVAALAKACCASEIAWRTARPKADFAAVLPHVGRVLDLVREAAQAKAAAFGLDPYDALLDDYDPGARRADVDRLFAALESFLPELLGRVLERQRSRPAAAAPEGPFPKERQRAVAVRLMQALGFDFEHGRLDASLHPFCGGTPEDVRVTTRYEERTFLPSLMAVLHETGHALYERGLPAAWRGQPVGESLGMTVHESQSLLVEMQVCRDRPFVAFLAPVVREAFGQDGLAWEPENLFRLHTRVERGLIRVDADEVTYPLHVLLRYRLETALLARELALADLPAEWNAGMRRLVGVAPPSDREGCLQDLHWYDGAFGYFPCYTLGALAAAQLFQALRAAHPDLDSRIAAGDFSGLLGWLRTNVHEKGSFVSPRELIAEATGRPLGAEAFKFHLERRYLQ
jgi:carboxypeptidase Taq